MRRFLKYELDRYLRGRGGELIEELPLMRVENQPYIHYRKGSLVFYRLREEIGEENLNRALAAFIRDKAFQQPPYTTTLEMLDYIRAQTPPEKQRLIDELFAKIVLYDTKVVAASATKRADGKFDVRIEYEAQKSEADGVGKETPLSVDDWMDVAVFARQAGRRRAHRAPAVPEAAAHRAEQGHDRSRGRRRAVRSGRRPLQQAHRPQSGRQQEEGELTQRVSVSLRTVRSDSRGTPVRSARGVFITNGP